MQRGGSTRCLKACSTLSRLVGFELLGPGAMPRMRAAVGWATAPLGVSWKLAVASLTGCSLRMPIQAQFDVSMRAVGCYSM